MPAIPTKSQQRHGHTAFAGLDFIKAAFCPLEFNAVALRDHPRFAELRRDAALAQLEVSDPLNYPRQFPYTDTHGKPIDRGLPGPGLLAHVAVGKFSDHLPLYRLEDIFARAGMELSRSTLCRWARHTAARVSCNTPEAPAGFVNNFLSAAAAADRQILPRRQSC